MSSMRIVAFLRRLLGRKVQENEHTRLHGQKGKYVQFPRSLKELDESYGAMLRELSKR